MSSDEVENNTPVDAAADTEPEPSEPTLDYTAKPNRLHYAAKSKH
jgi:hypothetical protein